ncbi:50S ribosomal protein L3 [Candidatus Aerophobetes bacterium]|nr:50S ribosomal protein L3 [Candidatus Aerophobetes bacterium]
MKAMLGKKLGMTQVNEGDEVVSVTILKAGPCVVVQKKEREKDGYSSVQLGFEEVKEKILNKPQLGHFEKYKIPPRRYLREVKVSEEASSSYKIGDEITVDIFKKGDLVSVTGVSKGKGFAGVMKRHGFKGGPASHGAGQWHRRPGSIGASASPSRVFKGKKMPGRMGGERVTVRGLKVVDVDKDAHVLWVKGACPGKNGELLIVREERR